MFTLMVCINVYSYNSKIMNNDLYHSQNLLIYAGTALTGVMTAVLVPACHKLGILYSACSRTEN